ncbi:hypothetical protein LIER_23688 [Lithospermum erythrorhizon]|uniref:Uncharacterized protein n=1 Tax=Lithospermum erythrorhizon TaxID=34254 RepID=A0AAV3R2E0_LITER
MQQHNQETMQQASGSLPPDTNNMADSDQNDLDYNNRNSNFSAYDASRPSCEGSPMMMSPWNQASPFQKSPWMNFEESNNIGNTSTISQHENALIGSLVREEGHIYSLAAIDDLLYTGSDSKNIRVWKDMKEFGAFKSNSGLVKAIIICSGKIFTGHQDGKIRVWRVNQRDPSIHKRSGTLPTFMDIFKASIRPKNYIEVKRNKTALWIKHCDAISSLSMCEEKGILYSASWDRTFKVWRTDNSKCLESVKAHDDAVNAVVASVEGMVYTGSADGTVKVWKRETKGRTVRHDLAHTLLSQECAVTALAVDKTGSVVYCGSSDGLVNFWERGNELSHGGVLKGHTVAVLCLAAAGNLLFSGSADKTICVWKREGNVHNCLSVLTGHTGPVKCLAVEVAKDSTESNPKWVVYSGSLDKSIKVWSVSEATPDVQQTSQSSSSVGGAISWDSIPSLKY